MQMHGILKRLDGSVVPVNQFSIEGLKAQGNFRAEKYVNFIMSGYYNSYPWQGQIADIVRRKYGQET
jgi:hypothetical protein